MVALAPEGIRVRPAGSVPVVDQLKAPIGGTAAVQVAEYGVPTLTGPVVGVQLNVRIG